ncbi:calmodulin-like protein [Chrysochromulina tobinii]|uniref:Calmodulin-like protein n=1 Tax=Chrysochromulina tobinii TaxID=1460289 RepID=A0A0M0J2Q3_9EUKA|nr:calmodulin-like protein [Chrysochromulina tobinii]|eukprot:KOO20826.1 calmodulin-like protein [Chrysochromulina sp. CCMP291]
MSGRDQLELDELARLREEVSLAQEQLKCAKDNAARWEAEELTEFREIFNLVDLDKGGTISKDELGQLMKTLGLKPTQEELNAMVAEIDADGSGEIDFDEFVTVMSRKELLSQIEPDENGMVNYLEFVDMMTQGR